MSWERALLIVVVALLAAAYYLLAGLALRDLIRRPAVRGDNKATWALVIICLPIAGALLYGYMGAASLLPRASSSRPSFSARLKSATGRDPGTDRDASHAPRPRSRKTR
jgi:hypothetical protein